MSRSGGRPPRRPTGKAGKTGGGRQGGKPPARTRQAAPRPDGGGGAGLAHKPTGIASAGEQVEGRQAVRELLLAGTRPVREVLVATGEDGRLDGPLVDLVELAGDLKVPVRKVSRTKLDGAARTDAPQGVVAYAAPLPFSDLDDLTGPDAFLVAVDGVTDPGNLGALLRSAECAGVTGVVLPKHRAVHITPTVTKAAAGAVEHLPISLVSGLPAALEALKAAGMWIVGLDMGGDTPIHEVPFATDPVVLVLGAEGAGLSRLVRQRCDAVASIPQKGRLGSLNVAAAAAIATYEIARRRP